MAGLGALDAVGIGDDHQQLDVALVELVGQQLGRPGGFGVGVLESAGGQAFGDGYTEDAERDSE